MTTPEYRSLLEPIEFRSEGGKLVASGVAMRYGAKSKPIRGQFREVFTPGAFSRSLQSGSDVRAHLEHGGGYLGRTGAGTLRITDNRSEMAYEIDVPDTTAGRDAAVLLERRDLRGASVGFNARKPKQTAWSVDDDGMALRSVHDADLFVLDLTVAPYYTDTTAEVALRSFADEHNLELRSVIDATRAGTFATLLDNSAPPEPIEDASDVGETVVVRRLLIDAL